MVHQPPANPAAMDTYLGDLTVVDGFEMDEDGFSLVPAPTVDLATAWCPPIQPGQRTVLLGLPFEILRAIMAYVAVNEKTKQINMKIIRRFSTMNSVLRAVALDFLFRNVTVPMRYKYHGDAAMVAGLAQNPHLLRHARSIFLKANSAWISHHGALVVGETGPRMPPDTLARLLGAMPLLTTLTLDEMLVDDEDYLLRACRDVLPRLTTLTLHVAHWNAPEELIAACTGLRTLRLNCNGHAKGPEPGDCDHIDMALAAAGGLPLLETLDMFKFAHQQEDLDVGERPIQVTVGWDVASIISTWLVPRLLGSSSAPVAKLTWCGGQPRHSHPSASSQKLGFVRQHLRCRHVSGDREFLLPPPRPSGPSGKLMRRCPSSAWPSNSPASPGSSASS